MTDKEKRFKFVVPKKAKTIEKDPESIFRELQIATIKGLWSQQADILREYYSTYKEESDVAFELPTGTGKTLVGLLIAEYRRRCREEKVVYLCPTRQLAYQVYRKAQEYKLPAVILVGPQAEYSQEDYGNYITKSAIAITTYSAIFNTNPKLNDADTIIFDDAHSAENYISSLWTLNIKRKDCPGVFNDLLTIFKDDISEYTYSRIMNEDYEYYKPIYDLVPYPKYIDKLPDLIDYLENHIEQIPKGKHPWSKINDNLHACQMFFSWGEITIRPLIPPTLTHSAFSGAKQRIYMSATLGEGGELERISGVKKIKKIPVPKGWDVYSNGRRLILFPNRKFDISQSLELTFKAIIKHEKALVLCPDAITATFFKEEFVKVAPEMKILESQDIEESLDPFINERKAILLLTSRYDGIDLSGETCRLLVLFGMPEATNLQEGFLWNRLSANTLLNELVKTRITQALGRCTRSSDDYANVLMVGSDFLKFIANNIGSFHPELQAEIAFGLKNSEMFDSVDEMLQFMDDFINDNEYFSEINEAINGMREEYEKTVKTETAKLKESVYHEVEFVYALWKNELDRALEKVKTIIDTISGGKELDGYRAWWFYQAGNCAYWAQNKTKIDPNLTREYYSNALKLTYGMSWISDLIHHVPTNAEVVQTDPYLISQVENIENIVSELGLFGQKFERKMNEFLELINNDDARKFEKGLEKLGTYLGFESESPKGDGTPDGIWILRDIVHAFESKTEEDAKNPISISICRQASGHRNWVIANRRINPESDIKITVISHKNQLHPEALPHSRNLFHVSTDEIRKVAVRICQTLRSIRSTIARDGSSSWLSKEIIGRRLVEDKLTYREVMETLTMQRLDEMNK